VGLGLFEEGPVLEEFGHGLALVIFGVEGVVDAMEHELEGELGIGFGGEEVVAADAYAAGVAGDEEGEPGVAFGIYGGGGGGELLASGEALGFG
jgi:hypothetical protein